MKRAFFVLAGLSLVLPAAASPTVALKCSSNDDRIWVYDSLQSFNVSARLHCGASVQLIETQSAYSKIRMEDGSEGYVPNAAIPSQQIVVIHAPAASASASAPRVAPGASAPLPVAQPAQAGAQASAPVSMSPASPMMAAAAPEPRPVAVEPPQPAPPIAIKPSSGSAMVVSSQTTPVPVISAAPTPPVHRAAVVQEVTAPVVSAPSFYAQPVLVTAADVTPVMSRPSMPLAARDLSYSDEDGDELAIPQQDVAVCNAYFSAYGLTPMQLKWMADDRPKRFPGVCPAPEPSSVDYVIIFTHDLASFSTTLPAPVHTDRTGFSDWSPIIAADDNIIPISPLDKAHNEYAWVFHVHRGTFNPSAFSARRRPQFTKREVSLHASSKTAEDAMHFIAQGGPK